MIERARGSTRGPSRRRCRRRRVLCALLLGGICCARAAGEVPLPRIQVQLEPPPLVRLAAQLAGADIHARREFALVSLRAMRSSFLVELRAAAREQPATAERKAKLARWQGATRDLVRQLDGLIERLDDAPAVRIQVDGMRQIILLIDRTPVMLSTPTAQADRETGERILADFCAFNDCSFLDGEDGSRRGFRRPPGSWLLRQDEGPIFQVESRDGGWVGCEFASLHARHAKASLCRRVADEVERLAADLAAARALGHDVDWSLLARQAPRVADEISLVLNDGGAYIRVALPLTGRLHAADWQRLVDWLGNRASGTSGELRLRDVHLLL